MEEIKIVPNPKDKRLMVVVFPKWKPKTAINKVIKKIDVIELRMENSRAQKLNFMMTPDEALEIAGLLTTGVNVYLNYGSKEFKKKFLDVKDKLCKDFEKGKYGKKYGNKRAKN